MAEGKRKGDGSKCVQEMENRWKDSSKRQERGWGRYERGEESKEWMSKGRGEEDVNAEMVRYVAKIGGDAVEV